MHNRRIANSNTLRTVSGSCLPQMLPSFRFQRSRSLDNRRLFWHRQIQVPRLSECSIPVPKN